MNGSAFFVLTPHGWRCQSVYKFIYTKLDPMVRAFNPIKTIALVGKFKEFPKAGSFCKRPHKYLEK